jgi:hypothetical protein
MYYACKRYSSGPSVARYFLGQQASKSCVQVILCLPDAGTSGMYHHARIQLGYFEIFLTHVISKNMLPLDFQENLFCPSQCQAFSWLLDIIKWWGTVRKRMGEFSNLLSVIA